MWSVLIDDALPPKLFSCLHDRLIGVDVDPFNRHSYWFPLTATPRLLVEHAIRALRPYIPGGDEVAARGMVDEAKPPGRGVKWHFDNDHEVERRDGRQVFPVFASILYFGSIGGPTVIVDQMARGAALSPDTPTEALVYCHGRTALASSPES